MPLLFRYIYFSVDGQPLFENAQVGNQITRIREMFDVRHSPLWRIELRVHRHMIARGGEGIDFELGHPFLLAAVALDQRSDHVGENDAAL